MPWNVIGNVMLVFHISKMLSQNIIDTLRTQIVKNIFQPVNDFLFIFTTKLLLIYVFMKALRLFQTIFKMYNSNTFKQRKRTFNM